MNARLSKPNFFIWFSLISHVALFLLFYLLSVRTIPPPSIQKEKSYYYYVPSYAKSSQAMNMSSSSQQNKTTETPQKSAVFDKTFDLSQIQPATKYQDWNKKSDAFKRLAEQSSMSQQQQKYQEAIHLVGEEFLDDPLRKLLGKAITPHIYYPDTAKALYLRGVVSIALTLHPDGTITDIRMIKSSRERMLDKAALQAINDSSPINGVDLYVKQPRHLVINIIF